MRIRLILFRSVLLRFIPLYLFILLLFHFVISKILSPARVRVRIRVRVRVRLGLESGSVRVRVMVRVRFACPGAHFPTDLSRAQGISR